MTVLLLFSGSGNLAPIPTQGQVSSEVVDNVSWADTVAQCFSDKKVKFYGAFWCPHCADQKKIFGESMKYVDYVECDPRGENARTEECAAENIESFPTWIFANGERLIGVRTLDELAKTASCN